MEPGKDRAFEGEDQLNFLGEKVYDLYAWAETLRRRWASI